MPLYKFTLDTNCLIDVEERRAGAKAVRALADAHAAGMAEVAVVAIAASEKQKDGKQLQNFADFEARLSALQLGHLEILNPMLYGGITFWDHSLWVSEPMVVLEKAIHEILFPTIKYLPEHVEARDDDLRKWRNAKCDVQAYWAHVYGERDIFVTTDANYYKATKMPRLLAFGAHPTKIVRPIDAALLLPS